MKVNIYYKGSRQLNTFTINNVTYCIKISEHAELRLSQRKLDLFKIVGAILSLGENKIKNYSNTNKDIFIMDNTNNFSVVCYIKNYTIMIVTVLNKADCYVREGTDVINL
jgi:hypothetical protein